MKKHNSRTVSEKVNNYKVLTKTSGYVLVKSNKDLRLAFPDDVFKKSKNRKPRKLKRNRVRVNIEDTWHTFYRREWKHAIDRMAYYSKPFEFIDRENKYRSGMLIASEQDCVIMPTDEFEKARYQNFQNFQPDKIQLFLERVLYTFTLDQPRLS